MRRLIFWFHLSAGVTAGLVILLMSVTGVLLTYERQMVAWADRSAAALPPAPDAVRMPVEQLLASVRAAMPGAVVTAVTIASETTAPALVTVAPRTLAVNVYTGAVIGDSAPRLRNFFRTVTTWHRYIAVSGPWRPIARAITGWANFLFLLIVLGGLFIWFPRKWTFAQVRAVTLFKGGLRGRARDFNWHNVIGVWSAVPLAIVVLGAIPISFPWANAAVYRAVGETPPVQGGARQNGPGPGARAGGPAQNGARQGRSEPVEAVVPPSLEGLNALWARAERQSPDWRTINLRIPASDRAPVVFAIDNGNGGQPQYRSTLTLARATGDVVSVETFGNLTLGRRIRNVMRFAHTGEVLGLPGQTVAGLVSAGGAVLVWTGLALAWRRFRAWARRRAESPAAQRPASVAAVLPQRSAGFRPVTD